jgi:hypothetical protein
MATSGFGAEEDFLLQGKNGRVEVMPRPRMAGDNGGDGEMDCHLRNFISSPACFIFSNSAPFSLVHHPHRIEQNPMRPLPAWRPSVSSLELARMSTTSSLVAHDRGPCSPIEPWLAV